MRKQSNSHKYLTNCIVVILMLLVTGCVGKQDATIEHDQDKRFEYAGPIPYDSCYWIYNPLVGNTEQINNIDNNFITESDSAESKLVESSKQILKDLKIKYEKRYEGISDRSDYFENNEDAIRGAVAFMDVLSDYMYTHGYKKIEEEQFLQKVKFFFYNDYPANLDWLKEIVLINDSLHECNDNDCMSLNHRIYLNNYACDIGSYVDIKGARLINDGVDPYIDEPINERMDMESFNKGELVLKNVDGFFDINEVLYTHLYLFNNNKAAKNWLLSNKINFFFKVIPFYDDDDEINRKKLDYMISQCVNEYGIINPITSETIHLYSLIDDGLKGRNHNMMKLIFEETDKAMTKCEQGEAFNNYAFNMLQEYFYYIWVYYRNKSQSTSFEGLDLLCMFAKMEVSLNKKHCKERKNGWSETEYSSWAYMMLSDTLLKEAERNNYYNIPNFDEVLKVIEWDKEHDIEGKYPDKVPFDYTTLLPKDGEK